MTEIIKCEICGQDTVWERIKKGQPKETEHCQDCDRNVCEDCFCWATADGSTNSCKDCCGCYITEDNFHWKVSISRTSRTLYYPPHKLRPEDRDRLSGY